MLRFSDLEISFVVLKRVNYEGFWESLASVVRKDMSLSGLSAKYSPIEEKVQLWPPNPNLSSKDTVRPQTSHLSLSLLDILILI